MNRPQMLAADWIRDLVQGFTTTERVTQPRQGTDGRWRPVTTFHTLTHPALLDQLEAAVTLTTGLSDDDAARGAFGSKPAAHLEAVDVLARIRAEACDLAHDLDVDVYRKTPTKAVLLGISGKVGHRHDGRVQRWWVAARLATQWDSRPFQPAGVPCMQCWELGSLRIDAASDLARCVECHTVWDGPAEIANLAQYVKWCSSHEVTKPRHWSHDDTGELVECVECLAFRDAYADWKVGKQSQARAERATPGVVVDSVA